MDTALRPGDSSLWFGLPADVRAATGRWIEALEPVMAAPHGKIGPLLESAALRMGTSVKTVRRMYDFARKGRTVKKGGVCRGWQALVDWRKVNAATDTLPEAFIQFWKYLVEKEQRKTKPAWRKLIHMWRDTDAPIPGYETRPEAALNGIPDGWSYTNLLRYQPDHFERAVARQGRSAAAKYRSLVWTTRVGLEAGQFYTFDDLEHDLKVNFVGVNRKALRPLELCALDLFSACKVRYGVKPMLENDDGSKAKLKERDMRFLLAALLTNAGYRRGGTTLLVEHGTAAVRGDLEQLLFDATGGAIKVQRSGIEGAPALHGWYEGRGKGNFRLKAALESQHSLVHNETAALPGQMGLSRDAAPEELHGRDKANALLVEACKTLAPDRAALLRFPFIEFVRFREILEAIYMAINSRTEHDLEGWEAAGLLTQEFRLHLSDKRWLPAAHLDQVTAEQRTSVMALIERPGYTRCRKLSPLEVWNMGRRNLVQLPWHVVPSILTKELSDERKVGKDGLFTFEARELGPDVHRYLARARNTDGREVLLDRNETYLTFVNPFDPRGMIVCDADEAFIGVAPRLDVARRIDPEEIARSIVRAAHEEALRLEPYRARHAVDVAEKASEETINASVLSGSPVSESERAADRARRRAIAAADPAALLDDSEAEEVPVPALAGGDEDEGPDVSRLL